MYKFKATINTLNQLKKYINMNRLNDIKTLEEDDNRYSIAINNAISGLKTVEQYKWERDIAISQLNELGIGLGENVDHIKKMINKTNKTKQGW